MSQAQYNGHASPGKHKHSGLFAVIEDGFYKTKQGAASPELNEDSFKEYSDSDKMRKESFYLHSTPETVSRPSAPEYQTGYSKIMDARLGVDGFSEPKISTYDDQKTQVSKVSSLGKVSGPEYQQRPNFAPSTLKPLFSRTQQPRKFDAYSNKNAKRKSYKSDKKRTSKPYFNNNQYDPFAFQSTRKSMTKQQPVTVNSILSF